MLKNFNGSFDTEIALFVVSPQSQGVGVGKTLFQYFIDQLKEK